MRRSAAPTRHSWRARLRPAGLAVASCFVFGLLATGAGAADPVFVHAPGSPLAASAPHSEVAADFNRDGKLDLAVANETADSVSIRLGDGTGGFSAPTSLPVGDNPLGLAVGDLNRDGRLDLAVANSESDNLIVLLGDGDGDFDAAGAPVPLADAPWYVAVGDVNRDRRLDLVVSHVGSGGVNFVSSRHVSVLLGDGNGGFSQAPGSPLTVGRTPYGVEVVDLNSDRNPDLAIANQFDDFVSILLGDGAGQFTAAPISPIVVGGGPSWLDADDFNGDGNPDLAVAVSSGNITVLLGDGAGGFTDAPGSPIAINLAPHNLRAADFDRDGELDLAVDRLGRTRPPSQPPNLSVLLGDGEGGFQLAGTPRELGSMPLSMAVGDFDHDGRPDVAIGENGANTVSVLLNRTVTPAHAIAALREEVRASTVTKGLRTSLTVKLLVAELTAGVLENRPACGALAAFVAEVQAAKGSRGLSEAVAQDWLADAEAIRADLGCAG